MKKNDFGDVLGAYLKSNPSDDRYFDSVQKQKWMPNGYAVCSACKKREYDETKVRYQFALFEIRWIIQYSNSNELQNSRSGVLICSDCFDKFWVEFLGRKQLYPSYVKEENK
jgi:hypothetical protein